MNVTTPATPPPDRVRKRITTLGHHLATYAEALDLLRARARKGRRPEQLALHVGRILDWLPQVEMPDAFQISLVMPRGPLDGWLASPGESPLSASAAARALLHLPGLRPVWEGWLRGSVLADLRTRLPRAWVMDPAPLPSHGAIAGLGLAAWADWARLRGSGRLFELRFADQANPLRLSPGHTEAEWEETGRRLQAGAPGSILISEQPPTNAGQLWQASFTRHQQRWEMADLAAASD